MSTKTPQAAVRVRRESLVLPTQMPAAPNACPAYLDNRVYQGSSGRVYPLPFHDRIESERVDRAWNVIVLENEYVEVVIAPELGGRILHATDRTRGYDMFYRNRVLKPALVGLLGPWISGGVEFNWPQHHRPATFLPVSSHIEHEDDGAITVWCSDHDPFDRMRGMHGIRLRPDSAVIEARVRLTNRTADRRTFLWWANVAARVHDRYQSFFPTDVHHVADHAKRAITAFPAADRPYYGWDYPAEAERTERGPGEPSADRIDFYRNVRVPTSYMVTDTEDSFFGGYDHEAGAGFVHVADRRIAPGKKMWTWGNDRFGWAWDRNLTDEDGPYVELMAGVYTDNQPDFAFLDPGETKAFSQFWFPIQDIGPVHQASTEAACRLDLDAGTLRIGVAVTRPRPDLHLALRLDGDPIHEETADAAPGRPVLRTIEVPAETRPEQLTLTLTDGAETLLSWTPRPTPTHVEEPEIATEPPAPEQIDSVDELYLTGRHLAQYRHATRRPRPYWEEGVRRDTGDVRCRTALAVEDLHAGRLEAAEEHLRIALRRLTRRNPNPETGEVHHRLAQVCARTGREDEALDLYGKAAWDRSWKPAAHLAMARILARRRTREADLEALALIDGTWSRREPRAQARCTAAVLLRRRGRAEEATTLLEELTAQDALDIWAGDQLGDRPETDGPTLVDIALEYASLGEDEDALRLLGDAAEAPTALGQVAVAPLAHLHRAGILAGRGDDDAASAALDAAEAADPTGCFASRPEDLDLLTSLTTSHGERALPHRLLGHLLYHLGRRHEAIAAWERAVALDDSCAVTRRNLALGAMNVQDDPDAADAHYRRARELAPRDAALLSEHDLLAVRRRVPLPDRLSALDAAPDLVSQRDDLTVTRASLLTATGQAERALEVLRGRQFQPWEGGEGVVLRAWEEAHLALARTAQAEDRPEEAEHLLRAALDPVPSLGEDRHPLAACSHLWLALGDALAAQGRHEEAAQEWRRAAESASDFRTMEAVPYSDLTHHAVQAARRLGDDAQAEALLDGMETYAEELSTSRAVVDYFATSLPSMLLFPPDLQAAQDTDVALLRAQAAALRGDETRARDQLAAVLEAEPHRERALELAREIDDRKARNGATATGS